MHSLQVAALVPATDRWKSSRLSCELPSSFSIFVIMVLQQVALPRRLTIVIWVLQSDAGKSGMLHCLGCLACSRVANVPAEKFRVRYREGCNFLWNAASHNKHTIRRRLELTS